MTTSFEPLAELTADERCNRCSFSPADWNAQDAARTFHHLELWWREVVGDDAPSDQQWDSWAAALAGDGAGAPAADALHDLHLALHQISTSGRRRHEQGGGAPTQVGEVVAVNASAGGVPKTAMLEGTIGWRGLEGDRQSARAHHGRPWQALCLWSGDVIERLQREGHPIGFGAAGENLTVAGIDWCTVAPGVRVQAGEVLVEISLWAIPCAKNAQWFTGGDFNRMSHERERGVSRMYGTVLRPGRVRPGDPFIVEPD